MNKPLVSLTIICYKAERFVKEAVEGALSQTYSPLEIIFSDDCSPDRTFDIICEAVKDYKGPHKIVLNRNERNMGIGAHVSKVWLEIATGDWIIVSAGDDVSLPHRVETLMSYAGDQVGAIHHEVIAIDQHSNILPEYELSTTGAVIPEAEGYEEAILKNKCLKGATMCLNRKMLLQYGPMNQEVVNEDNILAYRARHFGTVLYIDDALMKYRLHENAYGGKLQGNTIGKFRERILTTAAWGAAIGRQVLTDRKQIPMSEPLVHEIKKRITAAEIDLFFFGNGKFSFGFLTQTVFYLKMAKWVFFRPYASFRLSQNKS
jgi:glycosyltransferase involved in cell wall biosynthesis